MSENELFSSRGLKILSTAAVLAALAGIVHAAASILLNPAREDPSSISDETPFELKELTLIPSSSWGVFRKLDTPQGGENGPVSRFRLAGTFLAALAPVPGQTDRFSGQRAIIDDLQDQKQYMLKEGGQLHDYTVALIERSRVILRKGLDEYELTLGFDERPSSSQTAAAAPVSTNLVQEEQVLEVTQYGKRVGENRWVIHKDKLEAYWNSLMDSPERLASLYLSMKPDYNEGLVSGYQVAPKGEREFFQEIGLMDGDVIRRVNSMNMVSQARAEYFIREFNKDRLGAIVLDIDRAGESQKMIYLIR